MISIHPIIAGRPSAIRRSVCLAGAAFGALLLLLLAAGCVTTGGAGDGVARARADAAALAAAGDHGAAAKALEAVIDGSSGAERDSLLLEAAAEWFRAGNRARAVALADQRVAPIPPQSQAPAVRLVAASQALGSRRPEQALAWLQGIAQPAPEGLTAVYYELLGRTRFALGDSVAGVRALTERELWLVSDGDVAGNHQLLWRELLAAGPKATLDEVDDPVTAGWLALAGIARRLESSPGQLRTELGAWQQRYAGHPAQADILPGLVAQYRSLTAYPSRVALLLPLSGGLAQSAAAIRDGFVGARLDAGAAGANVGVDVYDTDALGAREAYAAALAGGAEFIVGPLRKEAVAEVATMPRRVPTLALNDPGPVDTGPGRDFFRFALSPEDEAAQAARRAMSEGGGNLIALVPNSAWGERMLESVRAEVAADAAAGGRLVDYGYYPPSAADFSSTIRTVLRLDQSERRRDALRSVLGEQVEFEPRRRADVDALFVAAPYATAKLIRPQLKFHFAADLPVYMTSAALLPVAEENRDLDGVVFADIPWLATASHAGDPRWQALADYAADGVRRARLYAFGVDAFGLLPAIWSGVIGNEVLLEGLTGTLRAEPDGRIARGLAFLTVRDGSILALPSAEAGVAAAATR